MYNRNVHFAYLLIISVIITAGSTGCNGPVLPDPRVDIIAFGDSTTDSPADTNYTTYLAEDLEVSEAEIVNAGKGGETTSDAIARLTGLIEREIYPNAETIIIFHGGNDLIDFISRTDPILTFSPTDQNYPYSAQLTEKLDQISVNLTGMINLAKQANMATYITTYYPMVSSIGNCEAMPLNTLLPAQAENANEYVAVLNETIRRTARINDINLIDAAILANTLTSDEKKYYYNCNHLSSEGNALLAELIAQSIPAGQN